MDEWLPIETAPDNGEIILVYGGAFTSPSTVSADGKWWKLRIREGSKTQPTHWMPLPPPPLAANAFTGTEP
jgi:hypothetical protein